jgi:hypothetical protein
LGSINRSQEGTLMTHSKFLIFGLGILFQLFLSSAVIGQTTTAKIDNDVPGNFNLSQPLLFDGGIWLSIYLIEQNHIPNQGRSFFTQSFDEQARDFIHGENRSPIYTPTEKKWCTYSDTMITALIGGTIATPLLQKNQIKKLLPISRAFALNNLASVSSKHLFSRKRPKAYTFKEVDQHGDNYMSFPSGHSSNAFVAASAFQELTPDLPMGAHALIYTLAGTVSLARIKGDRHYFSDVLIGAIMGVAISNYSFSESKFCENVSFLHRSSYANSPEYYQVDAILSRF